MLLGFSGDGIGREGQLSNPVRGDGTYIITKTFFPRRLRGCGFGSVLSEGHLFLSSHEEKSSMLVNRAVYIPPYARYALLFPLALPPGSHGPPHPTSPPQGARLHPRSTGELLRPLLAPRALSQGSRKRKQPRPRLHPLADFLVHALAGFASPGLRTQGRASAPGALPPGRRTQDFSGRWRLLPRPRSAALSPIPQGSGRHGQCGRPAGPAHDPTAGPSAKGRRRLHSDFVGRHPQESQSLPPAPMCRQTQLPHGTHGGALFLAQWRYPGGGPREFGGLRTLTLKLAVEPT